MLSDFNRKGKVKCRTDQRHHAIIPAARSWWKPAGSTVRSTCLSIQKSPARQQSVDTIGGGRKPESRIWKPILSVCSAPSRASTSGQRWQCRNGLCQQTDTGIHSRDLHGGFLIHLLPGIGAAKHKGLPGIADVIRNLRQTFFWLFCFGRIPWVLKSHPFPESHNIYVSA